MFCNIFYKSNMDGLCSTAVRNNEMLEKVAHYQAVTPMIWFNDSI